MSQHLGIANSHAITDEIIETGQMEVFDTKILYIQSPGPFPMISSWEYNDADDGFKKIQGRKMLR